VPDEPRIASGHAEIAEKARENVARRARAADADERTVATAAAAVAQYEATRHDGIAGRTVAVSAMGDHLSGQVARLAAVMRGSGARVGLGEVLAAERALAAVDA